MFKKWLGLGFLLIGLIGCLSTAIAQNGVDPLSGYWKEEGASVYIKVVNADGVYTAEMIRNDWSPGLVGITFFESVVPTNKKATRWGGSSYIADSSRLGKVTLRIGRDGKLTTRLKPGGSTVWLRSEAVEKRY